MTNSAPISRLFFCLSTALLLAAGFSSAQAAGSLQWVHSFAATDPNTGLSPDGASPVSGLTQGTDGNFYGSAYGGYSNGSTNGALIYRVTPAGDFSVLYRFSSASYDDLFDTYRPLTAVKNDAAGHLVFYHVGSANSDTTLKKITTDGTEAGTTVMVVHHFSNDEGGPRGAALYYGDDASGNQVLYAAGYGGGTRQRGTILKIVTDGTTDGTLVTVVHSFGSANDPQDGYPSTTLARGTDGNLYGSTSDFANTFFGETQVDNGKVFQFSPSTSAYNAVYTFPLSGPGTPSSVVESSPGVFFGTARSPNGPGILYKITVTGSSGVYANVYTFPNGGSVPVENVPLLLDADGLMYGVLDLGGGTNHTGQLFSLTPDGIVTDLYDFSSLGAGQTNADGSDPFCTLAIDADGNLYGTASAGGTYADGTVYRLNAPPKPPLPAFTSFNAEVTSTDGAPVHFTATMKSGLKVTVQFSTNPTNANSWSPLLDGGIMTEQPAGSGNYVLDSDAYPTGNVTFRAVATKPGSQRSISDGKGPFVLHGKPGLAPTGFTVNESNTPQAGLADSALRFAATQIGRPAGLRAHVEASVDGNTWTALADNNGGQMGFDPAVTKFILNSTSYPAGAAVSFRAVSTGGGVNPSISNVVGPFALASNVPRIPPPLLYFTANGHVADFDFRAKYPSPQNGVTVRVQVSTTPADEASWIAFDQAGFGTMTRTTDASVYRYLLNHSPYPDGSNIFFRALAQNDGTSVAAYGRSMPCGPFTITSAMPPKVTIHPPTSSGGTGTQDDPLIVSGDKLDFSVDAITSAGRTLAALALEVNGLVVSQTAKGSGIVSIPMPEIGDHVLHATAIDDLGAVARAAGSIFIRIVSSPASSLAHKGGLTNAPASTGRVFTAVADGNWADASTWQDSQGQSGVPYLEDMAIIGAHTVSITPSTTVYARALTLRGAHLVGNTSDTGYNEGTASQLKVSGTFTVTLAARIEGWMHIESAGLLELQNASDIQFIPSAGGLVALIESKGGCNVHGAAGIVGAHNFLNESALTFLPPLQIPPEAPTSPTAGNRLVQAVTGGGNIDSLELARTATDGSTLVRLRASGIVGENGSGVISNDGGTVISNDGGTLISQDGNNLISQDGNNLIGQDGNGLIGQDGNGIVAQGGGNFVGAGGGAASGVLGRDSTSALNDAVTPITITGGETNLDGVTLVGSVLLNGGVLSGSGVIFGDLTNNSGYISPGHSSGHLAVTGNFTQAASGTLVMENGGFFPSQYDLLQVGGTANLGGKLDLKVINGYQPNVNDTFSPLTFANSTGSFASVSSNASVTVAGNGLVVSDDITKPQPIAGQPFNISTRLRVLTNDNILIGGFIVTGPSGSTKKVLIRGIGPTLSDYGVPSVLSDPFLTLFLPGGATLSNDDWAQAPNKDQIPPGFAPQEKESVIVADLAPGAYTVQERGAHGEIGVGLVEVYDLNTSSAAQLGNISTRGFVDTGDNVMIGGFIVGGTEPARVLVRVTGPSLKNPPFNLSGAMSDPVLELHDANGNVLTNDDWRATQESEITTTMLAPGDDKEPAILATLVPGSYTAIVRGKDGTTGIGVVEAYTVK